VGGDRGNALLPVMLVAVLVSALAMTVSVVVPLETRIAWRFQESVQARYAAEGALSIAIAELRLKPDWTGVVSGAEASALAVGAFAGGATVPGGGRVELCCGPGSASAWLAAETLASPLPSRRAMAWRPYYWGTFDSLVPFEPPSRLFLIVWVANDEDDGDALDDRNQAVLLRAEAVEPSGLRRVVEATVARAAPAAPASPGAAATPVVEIVQWREVR
jgi:hypothetical protein